MPFQDTLRRFLFDNADIRGEIITLNNSYQQVVQGKAYPNVVARQLGEFLAAAGLLSATLKFNGTLSLQAQGTGPVSLLMADCTRHHNIRGIARLDETVGYSDQQNLGELLNGGTMAITVEPDKGERYQGLVPLASKTLAKALEFYFQQSEQLNTRLWFFSNQQTVAALMLQQMPESSHDSETNSETWERVTQLAETITAEELINLPHEDTLYRLFHEEQVRLFDANPMQYACSCSKQRTATALQALGKAEILSMIEEQNEIVITCEFCNQSYHFDQQDIDPLFGDDQQTLH